jgi:ribosomal protein L37AE/L43A
MDIKEKPATHALHLRCDICGMTDFVLKEDAKEWNCPACASLWLDAKKIPAPPMETVLLCVSGKVIPGWNESTQPEEDPSYCSWETWPESHISGEGVTHWMHLPKPPKELK